MPTQDAQTAQRLRDEFTQVANAVKGQSATTIQDPLGQDGEVTVVLNSFRSTGAGDIAFLKVDSGGDKRWTRYRSWGSSSTEYVEKSSFLKKADGATEFHRKRAEPGDQVTVSDDQEAEDQSWIATLA